MTYPPGILRNRAAVQPVLRLVDLFEESIEYERSWCLPFNSLCFVARENASDPSWVKLPEQKIKLFYEEGAAHFTTCNTPMRIRYTHANLHYCIHFRYELFPGADLFSSVHKRYVFNDQTVIQKIKEAFLQTDPLKKTALAEAAALEAVLKFWPEKLPLDLKEVERFAHLAEYVRLNLSSQLGIAQLAALMGWSEDYFSRKFHHVFHITPKQYLVRELLTRALELLKDPGKSVKEVAEELKFSSEFNFSRFVRHYAGTPPSCLRRIGQNTGDVRK